MSLDDAVHIVRRGSTGIIRYTDAVGNTLDLECELGGGNALLLIFSPTSDAWPHAVPWAAGRRDLVLERVAREVIRQERAATRYVVHDGGIDILRDDG